jgi:hypothetical protein
LRAQFAELSRVRKQHEWLYGVGVHLLTSTVAGTDARNTDGIDPGNSQNATVAKSWIKNGDDNIAIKANVQHMSVLENHFYSGHGMSMGSEARDEDGILVDTLTLDHTTSGVRIKANVQRGGLIRNIVYRNVCMKDVPVPISISPFYNGQTTDGIVDLGMKGNLIPDYKGIRFENVLSQPKPMSMDRLGRCCTGVSVTGFASPAREPLLMSSPRSSNRALRVKAPTEIRSTPVAAISRTCSSDTPPRASTCALPAICCTPARRSARLKLSSMMVSAPAASTGSI